jgi:molecular chaperone HscB
MRRDKEVICWSCEKEAGTGVFCGGCGAVVAPGESVDHFDVLGVPRTFAIDLNEAEEAYKRLSRQVHPDRYATADARARRASLAHTVRLNDAWRTVKDPVRRAEYLLALYGVDAALDENSRRDARTRRVAAPPAFLLEILELHDDLQVAQQKHDARKVGEMLADMKRRADEAMQTIARALDVPPGAKPAEAQLDEAARALIALRYYRRFLDEASAREARIAEAEMVRG